jgi:hypothetical protein
MYIILRDLSIQFYDVTIISGAKAIPYDSNFTKVLASNSLTNIINQIKKQLRKLEI